MTRYRKHCLDAEHALAKRKTDLETAPEGIDGRKVSALQKKVATAERAMASLERKTIATLVFDRVHGAEAKKDWFRSDFISNQPRN